MKIGSQPALALGLFILLAPAVGGQDHAPQKRKKTQLPSAAQAREQVSDTFTKSELGTGSGKENLAGKQIVNKPPRSYDHEEKLLKEAEQGKPESQLAVADAYNAIPDYGDAYMWYSIVEANPLTNSNTKDQAIKRSRILEELMAPVQVAEARIRTAQWRLAHSNQQATSANQTPVASKFGHERERRLVDVRYVALVIAILALFLSGTVFIFVRASTRKALREAGLL